MYGYGNSLYLTANKILASSNAGNPPINTVAPAITGTAQEGQVVTCSTGTWTGTAPITYAYQWKRNGSNIGSATNSTYTLVTADVSQSITCEVTATNAVGSANATSNTITPTSAIDPDAQAFITAANITNPTQQSAIITLVNDLKGYSIWTKFKAIYPVVGGIASAHAVNLKTPGTYNLSFATGWTHSATGMTPLGATYANTSLNENTALTLNNAHISVYSRTDVNGLYCDIGAIDSGNKETNIFPRYTDLTYARVQALTNTTVNNTSSLGLFIANRTSSTEIKSIKNTTISTISNASIGKVNQNLYIGAINNIGTVAFNSVREIAFSSIGDGLTNTEASNFYTAVQAFQTTLSRQV